jgi:predicted tellurium resistance membrane protein TerC
MERWPVIITIGAGLLGFVAGEMLVTDPALKDWLAGAGAQFGEDGRPRVAGLSLEILCGLIGAVIVVGVGTLLARRQEARTQTEVQQPKS